MLVFILIIDIAHKVINNVKTECKCDKTMMSDRHINHQLSSLLGILFGMQTYGNNGLHFRDIFVCVCVCVMSANSRRCRVCKCSCPVSSIHDKLCIGC